MANEHLFLPHLAGASSFNASQPDPNASLGSFMAAERIADHEGAVTGVNSDREIVDSSLPVTSFIGAWIVWLDTNLNEVSEVIDHDTGTDTLTFREVLPSSPVITDRYWLFVPGSLFAAADADICRRRATRYRLVYVRNETGADLDDVRVYVNDVQPGPLVCTAAFGVQNYPPNSHRDVDDIADDETAPLIGADQADFSDESQEFQNPRSYAAAVNSPFGTEGAFGQRSIRSSASNDEDRAMWIRLAFDIDSPIPLPSKAVFQVFIDSGDGVTVSSFLVVVDIDGVPETITPVIDRRLRIGGGARLSCIVLDSVSPFEPVPGKTIRIELGSGPGSVNAVSDTIQRPTIPAADGVPIRRIYLCPTDPGQVGASVQFDFEVT